MTDLHGEAFFPASQEMAFLVSSLILTWLKKCDLNKLSVLKAACSLFYWNPHLDLKLQRSDFRNHYGPS